MAGTGPSPTASAMAGAAGAAPRAACDASGTCCRMAIASANARATSMGATPCRSELGSDTCQGTATGCAVRAANCSSPATATDNAHGDCSWRGGPKCWTLATAAKRGAPSAGGSRSTTSCTHITGAAEVGTTVGCGTRWTHSSTKSLPCACSRSSNRNIGEDHARNCQRRRSRSGEVDGGRC